MTAVTPGRELLALADRMDDHSAAAKAASRNPPMGTTRAGWLQASQDFADSAAALRLAAKPASSAAQLSELDSASNACLELCSRHGFATGHGDTVADIVREIDAQITDRLAKPADPVDERLSIIVGVKTVLEFAIGLASDAERLIPDSEPKRLRGMLNNIRQGYLKPAVERLNAAAHSTTAEPKQNKEQSP